jgi:hypothetical protein
MTGRRNVSRRARRVSTLVVAIAVGVLAAPSAALGASVSGNKAAIAFYRASAATMNALPAYVQIQTGWVRIHDKAGKNDVAHWAWGNAQFEKGFYATQEHIELDQHKGSVVWLRDTLDPIVSGCHKRGCDGQWPLQFVVERNEAFWGLVFTGQNAECFKKVSLNDVPYTVGVPWWGALGAFSPALVRGSLTEITSKYGDDGQVVTETDLITTSTKRFAQSAMRAAAGHGYPAFTFRSTYRITGAPTLPRISLCS